MFEFSINMVITNNINNTPKILTNLYKVLSDFLIYD